VRVLVLADTHIPDHAEALPPELRRSLRRADLILHAGDVTSPSVLHELAAFAPTRVAIGNNDGADVADWGALPEVRLELEGVRLAMIHDAGPSRGRPARLRKRFPEAEVVVFGHSHIPMDLVADGQRLFNPGSPTWKRRQPRATYGWLWIRDGGVRARIDPA
jgi:putative phosphoesterase